MPTRREFLRSTIAFGVGFGGLELALRNNANATPSRDKIIDGFGPLLPDPDGIMDLPEGFEYTVFSRAGERMDDGLLFPGKQDGMAAFQGSGSRVILVCNHELSADEIAWGPFGKKNELLSRFPSRWLYDGGRGKAPGLGGTTNVVYNTATRRTEARWLSLGGTARNCAGGSTPWGTWITCEETELQAGGDVEKDHGYNFEVPARTNVSPVDPVPLKDMGRFKHEAVAVDEASGIIYETEDMRDGCIYRFIPNVLGQPVQGGTLQALRVHDNDGLDTRNWEKPARIPRNQRLSVEWIDLDDVESPNNDLRHRAVAKGAAVFARGEGMWTASDGIYFACTNGGLAQKGQIFKYVPSVYEGTKEEPTNPGALELFIEPNDAGLVDNADNLTVAPWGDLILCEDGGKDKNLVGVTMQGDIYKFARNAIDDSELAGATFAPDGSTLFVNMQHTGLSLAITGPWRKAYLRA